MIEAAATRSTNILYQLKTRFETSFYLQVFALVAVYYVSYNRWFIVAEDSSFSQPSMVLDVLRYSRVLLGGFVLTVFCLALNYVGFPRNPFYRRLNWAAFKADGELDVRYLVFVVALVLAWAFSSYEFNPLLNQAHVADRLLLLTLAFLVLVNPFFAPAFTLTLLIIVSQFQNSGIGNYAWIDKEPVVDLLVLADVFILLRLFVNIKPSSFFFLGLCLMASFYFIPAWAKIRLGPHAWDWLLGNHLHNIFVASYVNGWLGFLDRPTIMQMAHLIGPLDIPFQIYTLIFEGGALIVFARKRLTPVLIVGWILLHLGIFASSGIFFWKWIIVDSAILWMLWRHWGSDMLNRLYNLRYFALSVVIIALSPIYFSPSWLAWFDTRLSTVFHLEVVDAAGEVHKVDRGFGAPYDVIFSQNRFYYLSHDDLITITYGAVSDYDLAQLIEHAETPEAIEALRDTYGRNFYNEDAAQSYDLFIQTYFHNLNQHTDRFVLPLPLPPHHINSFPPVSLAGIQYPIQMVRVRFVEAYYNGDDIVTVQNKIIREIEIPQDE